MHTILALPALLCVAAMGWSIVRIRRSANWPVALLMTALFMGYAVTFFAATGRLAGLGSSALATVSGLAVGCLALSVVASLDRVLRERKRREAETCTSDMSCAAVIPSAVFCTDASGKGVFLNEAWSRLTGQRTEEGLGGDWFDRVHPADRRRVAEEWTRGVAEHRSHLQGEARLLRPDGTVAWVLWQAVAERGCNGETRGYCGTVTDISEAREASDQLRQEQKRFGTIYENGPMMIAGFTLDGQCRFWNPACEKVLGWTYAELAAARDPAVLLFPDPGERRRALEWISRGDGVFREYGVAAKDGSQRVQLWAEFTLADGTLMSVGTDITERTRAEKQLWAAYEELDGRIVARTAEIRRANDALLSENAVRRRAEDAARQAEERLEYLLGTSPAVIYSTVVAAGFPVTFVSGNIAAQLGYAPEEIVGVPGFWEAHLHPEDRERVLAEVAGLLANGHNVSEYRFLAADGTVKWLRNEARLVAGVGGDSREREVVGCLVDITLRKQAEEAQRDSDERFRKVFDDGALGIGVVGLDFLFREANRRFCDLLGYSQEELRAMSFEDITHPDDVEAERVLVQQLLDGKIGCYDIRKRYITKSKEIVPVEMTASLIRAHDGNPLYGVGMVQDIRQRVHAQEERDRIFDLSHELMCVADFDGHLRMGNPQFERTLGYRPEELAETPFTELVHPGDLEMAMAAFEKMRAGMPLRDFEVRWRCKNGAYKWLSWTVVPVTELRALYAVARDVTEAKRVHEMVEEHRDKMAHLQRLHTMGEMASQIAHELKQPLGAIVNYASGMARRLEDGGALNGQLREGVSKIVREGLRAGELIKCIREFVTDRDLETEPVDVKELVGRTVALAKAGSDGRIDIEVEADPGLPRLILDPLRIEQVIVNLLRNAIEATEATNGGGSVLMKLTRTGCEEVEVAVVDRGVGVRGQQLDQIFEPFFSTKPSGMGMGLAISRTIVQSHGGRIWACRNAEGGTTVRFTVPSVPESSVGRGAELDVAVDEKLGPRTAWRSGRVVRSHRGVAG